MGGTVRTERKGTQGGTRNKGMAGPHEGRSKALDSRKSGQIRAIALNKFIAVSEAFP